MPPSNDFKFTSSNFFPHIALLIKRIVFISVQTVNYYTKNNNKKKKFKESKILFLLPINKSVYIITNILLL